MTARTSIFILDPVERLDPNTDTSLALMRESQHRGHRVLATSLGGLYLDGRTLRGRLHETHFRPGAELFDAAAPIDLPLESADIVHMRKDPPVDMEYLHATYLLDRLPQRVLQVNPAAALRSHCEKLIPLHFPDLCPPTLVTPNTALLQGLLDRCGKIVVKPLEDCSGHGVQQFSASDGTGSLLQRATSDGERMVIGQAFLPEIKDGDKRVLLLGGEILGWVRRRPAAGDFRSNINAGGCCERCELTDGDRAICRRLGPWLRRQGIHFAGVDIVGKHLLEVNITSPSCLREINDLCGIRLEKRVLDYLEDLCR